MQKSWIIYLQLTALPSAFRARRSAVNNSKQNMFQQEIDRQNGYRPGVGILLVDSSSHLLLGCRENWLSAFALMFGPTIFEDPNIVPVDPKIPHWKFGWDIPQGGIEPNETFVRAIKREVDEELGPEWVDCIQDIQFLRKEKLNFPVFKDGRKWFGKTYYYHVVRFQGDPYGAPGHYTDWVYGIHQDEGPNPYPTPGFCGGVLFMSHQEACEKIQRTQGGQKGRLVLDLLDSLKQRRVVV